MTDLPQTAPVAERNKGPILAVLRFIRGSRLALPVSGDTLLRLIRAAEPEPYPSPRVVGIDAWAWKSGQHAR